MDNAVIEYHVTYGTSKKVIRPVSTAVTDIWDSIEDTFGIPDRSCILQKMHGAFADWCNIRDSETELATKERLNICPRESESSPVEMQFDMAELPSVVIKEESGSLELNDSVSPEVSSRPLTREDFPNPYILPNFSVWTQQLLARQDPLSSMKNCRRGIIKALFDDLLQYTFYPTEKMYYDCCYTLVTTYPHLKDANGREYGSWANSLKNKFKKHRKNMRTFLDNDELQRKQKLYGKKANQQ